MPATSMPIELQMMVYAVALFLATMVIQAAAGIVKMGPPWGFGNRDEASPTSGFVGRSKRTVVNSVEAMVMFAPLAIAAVLAQQTDNLSALGAQLFFYSRVGYVASYLAGIPYVRTLFWTGGLVGTIMVFIALFQ